MLKLWNTRSRSLESFKPINVGEVGLYTCGPTVYDRATIGNIRSYVVWDVLARTLRFFKNRVLHVMNITDVDDKTIRRAQSQRLSLRAFTEKYTKIFFEDLIRVNVTKPDRCPKATDHIPDMIALVETLLKKDAAYKAEDGVYFNIKKFPSYGDLVHLDLAGLKVGGSERVVGDEYDKEDASDFVLWKFWTESDGDVAWDAPFGRGRPGWHIECSAMAMKYLGEHFDIHAGGIDLLFPHHENESAQSQAATGKHMANYWLHNEHLLVDGRRMGKSEGNAYTLDDVISKQFDPLAFRYYCLGTHYRTKLNFTWEGLEAAQNALKNLQAAARGLTVGAGLAPALPAPVPPVGTDRRAGARPAPTMDHFRSVLSDDLNTPQALAMMWEMLKSDAPREEKSAALLEMDRVLGLRLDECIGRPVEIPSGVKALAEERQKARDARDWQKADVLREKIKSLGWHVEDREEGGYELLAS